MSQTEGFTAKQLVAIQALADPADNRNLDELARDLGVARATLFRWRQKPEFQGAITTLARESVLLANLPKVYAALLGKALAGNVRAIEILLTHVDDYTTRVKQEAKAELTGPGGGPVQVDAGYDLSLLTLEELETMRTLAEKAMPTALPPGRF